MAEHNDVIELLDILHSMISDARAMPMAAGKCIIEKDKALELISEIKAGLPATIAEANRLVSARDEFIGGAKREAEAMRKSAEDRARAMVEEQEIVRSARALANEIVEDAENKSKTLRRVAVNYVNEIMHNAESQLGDALKKVQQANSSFNSQMQSVQQAEEPERAPGEEPAPRRNIVSRISMDDDE